MNALQITCRIFCCQWYVELSQIIKALFIRMMKDLQNPGFADLGRYPFGLYEEVVLLWCEQRGSKWQWLHSWVWILLSLMVVLRYQPGLSLSLLDPCSNHLWYSVLECYKVFHSSYFAHYLANHVATNLVFKSIFNTSPV
jgi:hypothetical protein